MVSKRSFRQPGAGLRRSDPRSRLPGVASTWTLELVYTGSTELDRQKRAGEIVAAIGRPVEDVSEGFWRVTYVNLERDGDDPVDTQADAVKLLRETLDRLDETWSDVLGISAPSA